MRQTLVAMALSAASIGAWAQTQIDGLTFSVTTDSDYFQPEPYQYGYVTPGPVATSGMWGNSSEWIAARSEFDLTGQTFASNVTLSIQFLNTSSSTYPPIPSGIPVPMSLRWYTGDNQARLQDWGIAATPIGTLDVSTFTAGQFLSFDVTTIFNAAVARGDAALGIAIDNRSIPNQFASFRDFSLTVSAVPEPSNYAFMLAGMALLGLARRRHWTDVASSD